MGREREQNMAFNKMRITKTLSFAFVSALAMSALVQTAAAQGQSLGLPLIETIGATPADDTLSSPLAGLDITQVATNEWNINVSGAGITIQGDLPMTWAVLPGESGVDSLTEVDASDLDLKTQDTDVNAPGIGADCGGSTAPLAEGVSCIVGAGNGNLYFASVAEVAAAPEPASLLLSGLGLAGLAIAGIRRKRQA
jgi:hypothetical protein